MIQPPDSEVAKTWLQRQQLGEQAKWLPFFRNAPMDVADAAKTGRLKILDILVADLLKPGDALAQAGRWEVLLKADNGVGMDELVLTMQKWLFDLSRCATGIAPRYFVRQAGLLAGLAQRTHLPALLEAQKQVAQMRSLANHPLNPRLFLEDLCVRAFRPLNS